MKRLGKVFFALLLALVSSFAVAAPAHAADEREPCARIYSDTNGYVLDLGEETLRSESLTSLIASAPQGCAVTLEGITSCENITVSHPSLTLLGTLNLTEGANLVVDGGDVTLRSVSIASDGRAVRIKRGRLTLESGSVSAAGDGAVLDFSASAEYIQTGGALSSSGGVGLRVEQGTATVSGGRISSTCDSAIFSSSTLTLVGSPELFGATYDVSATTALTLYDGGREFSGAARVRFIGEVRRGRITCAFYARSESALYGITLYSTLGEELPLRFIEVGEYGTDESCGCVWLPYFVTFSFGEGGEEVKECMSTEVLTPPTAPERLGYLHTGWCYSDGESFDPSAAISADVTVYATYSLLPPSFRMSGEGFVFDGEKRYISVSELSHPLLDEGYLSFEWYKDGVALPAYTSSYAVFRVADSGEYHARITLTVGTSTVSVLTPSVKISIDKKIIDIPEIAPKFYTGVPQSPEFAKNMGFLAEPVTGTEVGIYPVRLSLADPDNTLFRGTEAKEVWASFEIKRAENLWLVPLEVSNIYTGQPPSPRATASFGEVRYLYAKVGEGIFTSNVPSEAGEYLVRAVVDATESYTSLESVARAFTIIAERAVGISVKDMPTKLDYLAFDTVDPEGISVEVEYNSGRRELLYAESLTFSYQSTGADNLRFGDSGVNVSFMGVSFMLPLNVGKAEYDMLGVSFPSLSLVYDGSAKTAPLPLALPVGLDGIPLTASVQGGGTDAATYSLTLSFSTESRNYRVPDSMSATLTVLPCEREVVWGACEFVYDGREKLPSAFYTDIYGRRIELSAEGRRSLAGSYTASAVSPDKNYTLKNPTAEYTILKADYDMSGAMWVGNSFVYDSVPHSVSLVGLPTGVFVVGYLNADATLAGDYVASATLAFDERNYNPPVCPPHEWQIARAEYPLGGYSFSDLEVVFDGAAHYPHLVGTLPVGIDGSIPDYVFSRGVTHVSEGRAAVTVIFSSTSRNYNPPPSVVAYVTVSPMEIYVEWEETDFVYNGFYNLPRAMSAYTTVTTTGGGVDAGDYVARAVSDSSDYAVVNAEMPFTVARAENAWCVEPSVSDIFFGRIPSPKGECLAGELVYTYYAAGSDEPLSETPRAVGEYILVISSEGDKNRLGIASGELKFSIIAVVPTSINATLSGGELRAMSPLTPDDISVSVVYNDGTSLPVPHRALTVTYQRGNELRFGDTKLTVSYLGFSVSVSVCVSRADYDMSCVRWENTLLIYDGTERAAYLSGLPSGVEVREYIGCRATAAGEYSLGAVLDYDTENYNPPTLPKGKLVIARCVVPLPEILPTVYDGKPHTPNIPKNPLYTVTHSGAETSAGGYPVTLTLTDMQNYTFPSGEGSAEIIFTVSKRPITVKVEDVRLPLFVKDYTPTYRISEGTLAEGDTLFATYSESDGLIYAHFDNPNYDVAVLYGKLEHTGALSSRALGIIIFAVLLLIFALLVLYLVLRHRAYAYCSARSRLLGTYADPSETVPPVLPDTPTEESEGVEIVTEAVAISAEYADGAISDSLAKDLIRRDEVIVTDGRRRGIINVDTLSRAFSAGDRVDVNILKSKSLIPYDTAYIKVLARGIIDKPLEVYANDFSLSAVKMIALSGGKAIRVGTSIVSHKDKMREKP